MCSICLSQCTPDFSTSHRHDIIGIGSSDWVLRNSAVIHIFHHIYFPHGSGAWRLHDLRWDGGAHTEIESNRRGSWSRTGIYCRLFITMLSAVGGQRGVSSPALNRRRDSRVRSSWFHTRGNTSRKWKVNSRRSVMAPSTDESKVFYYEMKGDYCHHLAEFATCETKSKAGEDACVAYAEATKIAEKDLAVTALITDVITRLQTESLDVCMSQVVEQVSEVPKTSSRNRTSHCTAEQILDVPVSERVEQLAEMPKIVSQDRIQQQTLEHIVDTPGPQAVEELAEISKVFSQDRVQQRSVEQTVEITWRRWRGSVTRIGRSRTRACNSSWTVTRSIPFETVGSWTAGSLSPWRMPCALRPMPVTATLLQRALAKIRVALWTSLREVSRGPKPYPPTVSMF